MFWYLGVWIFSLGMVPASQRSVPDLLAVFCLLVLAMLSSYHGLPSLDNSSVARIALVKPDKARSVEDLLINAAKRGQIQQKVGDC